MNYLIFDEQFNSLDAGAMRVPTTAGFDPGLELMPHREVKFQPVAISATGYMYIWVSNESENTKVWFDDLTITHRQRIVTQATDYGPWGDIVREQKTNLLDVYHYGYQGQFAEKDEETGWNHFELREYDPVVGRFTTIDPEGQFSSPYIGMGNDPINGVDPNGGYLFGIFGSTREQRLEARSLQSQGLDVSCITCREIKYSWTSDWQYDPNGSPVSWADNRQTDYHYTLDRDLNTNFVESVDRWSTNLATGQADFDYTFESFFIGGTALKAAGSMIGNISIPIYRVYGGGSSILGKSYSIVNPKYVPFYRNFAGLPSANSGQFLLRGYIPIKDIRVGRWLAAPVKGKTGGLPIELYQNFNQLQRPANVILRKPF